MCQRASGVMSQQQKPVHDCIEIDRHSASPFGL
jgi:hypothetical protein